MVSQVSESMSSEMGRRIQPTYGYYRQPNGWITISPITVMERVKYSERGWTHLAQYGAFDMSPYVANHPFEILLMFGGAHELSVDQLIQTGLYTNPPTIPGCNQHLNQFHRSHTGACWIWSKVVEFPQMAEVPEALIGPFACDFCDRMLPTVEGRDQHQSVMHKDRLGDMQTGKSLGISLAEALGNIPAGKNSEQHLQERIAELEAQLANEPKAASPAGKKQCECGGSYKPTGKNFHERGAPHKRWLAQNQPVTP